MSSAALSLVGLALAILIGILGKVNIGIVACGMAFLVGHFLCAMTGAEIIRGWPTGLFFMLLGMSLLFGVVKVNGTLDLLVKHCTYLVRGHTRLLPLVLLVFSTVLSALGPGNIAVVAVMMPLALAIARAEGISPLLAAVMVILGANAGGLSPLAPTGIIANDLARQEGLLLGWLLMRHMAAATLCCAVLIYFGLGGWHIPGSDPASLPRPPGFSARQRLTLAVAFSSVLAIVLTGWNIGLVAFVGAALLLLLRAAEENKVLAALPWSAMILVCGVAVMVSLVERAGGMVLLTEFLGGMMSRRTLGPVMSVVAGLMSLVSSASGVVLPTLIPTVRGVVDQVGGDLAPERLITVIAIGSHLVTISPFSTLGALAIAAADETQRDRLFRQMLSGGFILLAAAAAIGYIMTNVYG